MSDLGHSCASDALFDGDQLRPCDKALNDVRKILIDYKIVFLLINKKVRTLNINLTLDITMLQMVYSTTIN